MPAQIDLTRFAPRARGFLEELAANNSRNWFRFQKGRYDAEIKRPAERLLDMLVPILEEQTGQPVRSKLFRPHRDVRFSEDKTPYHAHLHAAWSVPDGRGWYFGLSPDYATAGAGVMSFDDEQLMRWRDAVSGPEGDRMAQLLSQPAARIDAPELETVPAPYPDNHPHQTLLRRKSCVVWVDDLFDQLEPDPVAGLAAAFDHLRPVQDWLGTHL